MRRKFKRVKTDISVFIKRQLINQSKTNNCYLTRQIDDVKPHSRVDRIGSEKREVVVEVAHFDAAGGRGPIVKDLDLHIGVRSAGDHLQLSLQASDGQIFGKLLFAFEGAAGRRDGNVDPAFGHDDDVSGLHVFEKFFNNLLFQK